MYELLSIRSGVVPCIKFITEEGQNIHKKNFINPYTVPWGTAVARLVEALRYKSEGRGFDSRWCHWNFSLT